MTLRPRFDPYQAAMASSVASLAKNACRTTPRPTLTKSLRPYPGPCLTLLGVRYILDGGILRKAGMSWEDFKSEAEVMHKEAQGDDDPCWKGYEAVGLKRKGKRMVPNCVPVSR